MNQEETLEEIRAILEDLQQEEDLPQKTLDDILLLQTVIDEPIDLSLRVDRCRSIIEKLDEKVDLDMYVRTQLWNLSALLERL